MSNDIETSAVTDPGTPPAGDPAETAPQGGDTSRPWNAALATARRKRSRTSP